MTDRTEPAEPTLAVIKQAAAWQAELADEHCRQEERVAFDEWLGAAPAHRIAFERMGVIAGRASRQDAVASSALRFMLKRPANHVSALVLVLAAATALLGWQATQVSAPQPRIADQRTAVGEIRSASLAGGDRITLDSDSAADFDEAGRLIILSNGGVMAKVQPGLPLPFVVRTPHGTAKALGTQYSVRIEGNATIVTVIESRVEACAQHGNKACLTLARGERAQLDARGARRLGDVEPFAASAWSEGLLIADDMPLVAVLAELNRYRADPIGFAPSELADLSVSGTLLLTDTNRALASIEVALPVSVEHEPEGIAVRRR